MFKPHHRSFLKVKIKSLAEEAKIIRHEERKSFNPAQRNSLHQHRTWDVRRESRAALLAYAYLRGRSLVDTEGPKANRDSQVDRRAAEIVRKFGTSDAKDNFQTWLK